MNHRCTVVRNLGEGAPWGFGQILLRVVLGEGVRTLKIRTSKGQSVKSIFRMIGMSKDQNVGNQNVKKNVDI